MTYTNSMRRSPLREQGPLPPDHNLVKLSRRNEANRKARLKSLSQQIGWKRLIARLHALHLTTGTKVSARLQTLLTQAETIMVREKMKEGPPPTKAELLYQYGSVASVWNEAPELCKKAFVSAYGHIPTQTAFTQRFFDEASGDGGAIVRRVIPALDFTVESGPFITAHKTIQLRSYD